MKSLFRLFISIALLTILLPLGHASAQEVLPPAGCQDFANPASPYYIPGAVVIPGEAVSGKYCITIPPVQSLQDLKGLVIFAHGYVFAYPLDKPVDIPYDQLLLEDPETHIVGSLPAIVNGLGFVFATTSYPKNGLAVNEGVASVVDLVGIVRGYIQAYYQLAEVPPFPVFLIGASEGGLVTTLAIERYPEVFTAGVAACGPVGDFQKQVNYWGDFRAVFDVYFPVAELGNDPVSIPEAAMADWVSDSGIIQDKIRALLAADLAARGIRTSRLLTATGAPIDPNNKTESIEQTVLGIMEYNVLATMEAISELGGNPFTNRKKIYVAIPWDPTLNRKVVRVDASPTALAEVAANYQTSGALQRPLVLLHTTGDPIVPYWHTMLYQKKVYNQGALSKLVTLPILRYGHCQFKPEEAVFAFEVMVIKAALQGFQTQEIEAALPEPASREGFNRLRTEFSEQVETDLTK